MAFSEPNVYKGYIMQNSTYDIVELYNVQCHVPFNAHAFTIILHRNFKFSQWYRSSILLHPAVLVRTDLNLAQSSQQRQGNVLSIGTQPLHMYAHGHDNEEQEEEEEEAEEEY